MARSHQHLPRLPWAETPCPEPRCSLLQKGFPRVPLATCNHLPRLMGGGGADGESAENVLCREGSFLKSLPWVLAGVRSLGSSALFCAWPGLHLIHSFIHSTSTSWAPAEYEVLF